MIDLCLALENVLPPPARADFMACPASMGSSTTPVAVGWYLSSIKGAGASG